MKVYQHIIQTLCAYTIDIERDIHYNTRCWILMNIVSYCIIYRISVKIWFFLFFIVFPEEESLVESVCIWWASIGLSDVSEFTTFKPCCACIRLPHAWVLLHMPTRYIVCCMTCHRILCNIIFGNIVSFYIYCSSLFLHWLLVCHTPSCLLYVSLKHVWFTCHVERLHPLCMA